MRVTNRARREAAGRCAPKALVLAILVASTLAVVPAASGQSGPPITDPIPEQPIASAVGLELEEFAQLPRSDPTPAPTDQRLVRWNRINYLGEVPDGSGRLYVPDLNGKLYLIRDGAPQAYLDVGATFAPAFFSGRGLGQGFGFVTFHPDFERNGRFYTVHVEQASLATRTPDLTPQPNTVFHGVVTEWTADDPSASTFSGSHREVLRIGFGGQIHGIQQIDFNPEAKRHDEDYGLLYLAVGDGGRGTSTDDPQNMAMPHGKLLRIDPQGTDGDNGSYGIPPDNPFVDTPGALGEIYAVGFRDPHRFSWDPGAGHRMFLGHIGEHAIEAVDEITPGANYGWSDREGRFVFDRTPANPCDRLFALPPDDEQFGFTYPVAAYDHDPPPTWNCTSDIGHAIVGGFVYRGRGVPGLRGKYVFADLVTGRLFYTEANEMRNGRPRAPIHELMVYDEEGNRSTLRELAGEGALGDPNRVDPRFGRDSEGELYLLSKGNGRIWRITGTRRFASCGDGDTRVDRAMGAENWAPVTPEKWSFPGREAILTEPGVERPGPRRPFEYAVLTKGPEYRSVEIDAEVRIDTPVEVSNRDVIIVFGYRSDTEFYYAHLSTDNTIYPHNGIFVVNNADRVRIEDQWDGTRGATPAITDDEWHRMRVVHCADEGEIAVYMDGSRQPLMTAHDTTFDSGRVGFGSFDNIGRLRDLEVEGTAVRDVLPSLAPDLVAHYDFEHPMPGNAAQERDRGPSGTPIDLVNGGAAMRADDGAHPGSRRSLQTQQVEPAATGNDDHKAGIYSAGGVPTLGAFSGAREATVMGWFKMTGENPSPNSNTADPGDRFNAIGLAGVLSGDSDGHAVRALLEVIDVSGTLRVVALGRRVDGSASQTFAADRDWQDILPRDEWVFLAATFNYDRGTMRLYRNGRPLSGFYTVAGDPWGLEGEPEPDLTSATDPRGIKLGGSFPQNTRETNPCNCRMDSLMFLDRAATAKEIERQYRLAAGEGRTR
jgi:Glucose / Sorbosone dehydrogenase